jgi:hypothetical protein
MLQPAFAQEPLVILMAQFGVDRIPRVGAGGQPPEIPDHCREVSAGEVISGTVTAHGKEVSAFDGGERGHGGRAGWGRQAGRGGRT